MINFFSAYEWTGIPSFDFAFNMILFFGLLGFSLSMIIRAIYQMFR